MGLLHDRAAGKGGVDVALAAAQDHGGTGWKAIRFTGMATIRADKAAGPAHGLKIPGASFIIREDALEFRKTGGKATRIHQGIKN